MEILTRGLLPFVDLHLWMGHLNRAIEAGGLTIKEVVDTRIQGFFEPLYPLKPNDFNTACRITYLCDDALSVSCAYFFFETNPTHKLGVVHIVRNGGDGMNHRSVLVTERKILN